MGNGYYDLENVYDKIAELEKELDRYHPGEDGVSGGEGLEEMLYELKLRASKLENQTSSDEESQQTD